MAMAIASETLIPLRDGPAVPASIAVWLIEVSWRLTFHVEPDGSLFVGPRASVTAEDQAFIRAHRDALLACVRYVEEQAEEPL